MKRCLMVILAVLLFSTAASAQTQGYVCLFSDASRTSWCGNPASIPGNFMLYVFILPEAGGTYCAEFMLDYPENASIIFGAPTFDGDLVVVMGDLVSGVSACYEDCRTGWMQLASQMVVLTAAVQGTVSIVPHPTAGGPNFTECVGNNDIYSAVAFNNLYIGYQDGVDPECGQTATEDRTWGAIKSMYSD